MSSREIKDLTPSMQVKYNKFYDRVRRDVDLLKHGISIIVTCTARSQDEQNKLAGMGLSERSCPCIHRGKDGSSAFDIAVLRYGKVVASDGDYWDRIVAHAADVGLKLGCGGFYE